MEDRCFENLRVWQSARKLANDIYDVMQDNRDYGFKDQIQRAAVSIMNNIAEGSEVGSDAKYNYFLNIAKGSSSEVRSMLYICLDRNFCTKQQFEDLRQQTISISKQLYKLIDFLNKQKP